LSYSDYPATFFEKNCRGYTIYGLRFTEIVDDMDKQSNNRNFTLEGLHYSTSYLKPCHRP